jgi:hypothetical protein
MMFARHQFELSSKAADGVSVLEHLELVYERTGELPELLANAPECPTSVAQLWADFLDLHSCRSSNGFSMSRITWRDIADWQAVKNIKLTPWDIEQIQALDNMWLAEFAPKGSEEEQQ